MGGEGEYRYACTCLVPVCSDVQQRNQTAVRATLRASLPSCPRQVVLGTVRREYTCLQFSADGMWLYCGTASADVVTVNVQRRSVQVGRWGRALMYDNITGSTSQIMRYITLLPSCRSVRAWTGFGNSWLPTRHSLRSMLFKCTFHASCTR